MSRVETSLWLRVVAERMRMRIPKIPVGKLGSQGRGGRGPTWVLFS